MTKKRFEVRGMHCVNCTMTVEGALEELPGVKVASANYARQWVDVEFDERQVTDEHIFAAIKAAGYDPHIQT